MKLVTLSATHGRHSDVDVPDGDVLIHAGDFTRVGNPIEVAAFANWLAHLPHRHKLVIAGNHERLFQEEPFLARQLLLASDSIRYLQDEEVVIEGVRFWGSPWTPHFRKWWFTLSRGPELAAHWGRIPEGIDVLITHGPPQGILDPGFEEEHAGDADLLAAVLRVAPRFHVFGHLHSGYGISRAVYQQWDSARRCTTFVNAAICDEAYEAVKRLYY